MSTPDPTSMDRATPPPAEGSPNARYAYLVARLRGRQITMEEATELFGLLQGMLRDSQLVRARLERSVPPAPSKPHRAVPATPSKPAVSEDWLLLGLLALGAGAGLGAAFARRLSDPKGVAAPPAATKAPDR